MNSLSTIWPIVGENITKLLDDHDIQPTQQRVQIAEVLFMRPQHLAAENILELLNTEDSKVSKATVYNTLGLFAEKGLVNEVNVDPSRIFYDSNVEPHHHFYNVTTGVLSDIDPDDINISQFPVLPEGTRTSGVDVIIRIEEVAS